MTPSAHNRHSILLFSSFASLGWGGQESLWHLVSRLDPRKFRPVVVLPHAGSLSERLLQHRIEVRFLELPRIAPASIRKIIRAERKLLSIIDLEHIDILHTDGPRNTFFAGVAGRLRRKPVLWHVRSSTADSYDRLLCLLCSKVLLVADCLAHRFRSSRQKHKLVTIHNGVDVDQFVPWNGKRKSDRSFGFRPDDIIITVSARVEKMKGQRYAIEACSQLRRFLPRLHIVFAGEILEQAYHSDCILRANELGIADHVHFVGHVEDIRPLLQATDIFLLPSIAGEAFSRSILEAMSCGLPVVATDCGGAREAVEHGASGYLIQPQNSTEMAQCIGILFADRDLRKQMGMTGRKIVVERFGIERNVEVTVAIYNEIIQGQRLFNAFAARGEEAQEKTG